MSEQAPKKQSNYDETLYDAWRLIPRSTGYRLLQKAEWEYACRAGTTTDYSIGDDDSLLVGYCQMYPSNLTSVCGEKLPNAWGLHDVHGNVWEWCWEKYGAHAHRDLRGGSFNIRPPQARSAIRIDRAPDSRSNLHGFRVARTLNLVPLTTLPPAEGGAKFEN